MLLLYRLIPGHQDIDCDQWIYPQIPHSRLDDEDNTTERICVAEDPDNCLTSMGFAHICLKAIQKLLPIAKEGTAWEDAWTKLRFPFTVLMFQIDENDPALVLPEDLEDKVPDAKWTREHWITRPTKPDSVEHLWLTDAITEEVMVADHGKHYACFLRVTDSHWSHRSKPVSRFFADDVKKIVLNELRH